MGEARLLPAASALLALLVLPLATAAPQEAPEWAGVPGTFYAPLWLFEQPDATVRAMHPLGGGNAMYIIYYMENKSLSVYVAGQGGVEHAASLGQAKLVGAASDPERGVGVVVYGLEGSVRVAVIGPEGLVMDVDTGLPSRLASFAFDPSASRVVVASAGRGGALVKAVSLDTGEVFLVASFNESEGEPYVASCGSTVVVYLQLNETSSFLARLEVAGGEAAVAETMTIPAVGTPGFLPDCSGAVVAGKGGVYVALFGGELYANTEIGGSAKAVVPSPRGGMALVLFEGIEGSRLYVVDDKASVLYSDESQDITLPKRPWSPEGGLIAYSKLVRSAPMRYAFVVADPRGGPVYTEEALVVGEPYWLPDGRVAVAVKYTPREGVAARLLVVGPGGVEYNGSTSLTITPNRLAASGSLLYADASYYAVYEGVYYAVVAVYQPVEPVVLYSGPGSGGWEEVVALAPNPGVEPFIVSGIKTPVPGVSVSYEVKAYLGHAVVYSRSPDGTVYTQDRDGIIVAVTAEASGGPAALEVRLDCPGRQGLAQLAPGESSGAEVDTPSRDVLALSLEAGGYVRGAVYYCPASPFHEPGAPPDLAGLVSLTITARGPGATETTTPPGGQETTATTTTQPPATSPGPAETATTAKPGETTAAPGATGTTTPPGGPGGQETTTTRAAGGGVPAAAIAAVIVVVAAAAAAMLFLRR